MWKPEHRRAADRRGLRYPSDLSDAEWALVDFAHQPTQPMFNPPSNTPGFKLRHDHDLCGPPSFGDRSRWLS